MTPPKPPSLPAASTECTNTIQLAAPGSVPSQISYKMARSADGQTRVDYGATSVISNPATGVTLLLDHAKQEVRAIPTPPGLTPPQLTSPGLPGMPAPPTPPTAPGMQVKDLGTKMVQGVEVHGTQITLPPLTPPKPPAAPQVPGMPGAPAVPSAPAVPGAPAAPAIPKPPQVPMVAESWVSTKLQMPVLSRITGSFGQQMCHCKNTVAGAPPPTAFQVPPNYKQVGLPSTPAPPGAPAPPAIPWAPAMPAAPKIPGAPAIPAAPKLPAAPAIPGVPAMPAAPAAPAAPAMPAPPKPPTFKF